eukprot:scaffold129240_cov41-Prasinocladus_malaysianus.AAC.1
MHAHGKHHHRPEHVNQLRPGPSPGPRQKHAVEVHAMVDDPQDKEATSEEQVAPEPFVYGPQSQQKGWPLFNEEHHKYQADFARDDPVHEHKIRPVVEPGRDGVQLGPVTYQSHGNVHNQSYPEVTRTKPAERRVDSLLRKYGCYADLSQSQSNEEKRRAGAG